jgi:hypothetical protein
MISIKESVKLQLSPKLGLINKSQLLSLASEAGGASPLAVYWSKLGNWPRGILSHVSDYRVASLQLPCVSVDPYSTPRILPYVSPSDSSLASYPAPQPITRRLMQ